MAITSPHTPFFCVVNMKVTKVEILCGLAYGGPANEVFATKKAHVAEAEECGHQFLTVYLLGYRRKNKSSSIIL